MHKKHYSWNNADSSYNIGIICSPLFYRQCDVSHLEVRRLGRHWLEIMRQKKALTP